MVNRWILFFCHARQTDRQTDIHTDKNRPSASSILRNGKVDGCLGRVGLCEPSDKLIVLEGTSAPVILC